MPINQFKERETDIVRACMDYLAIKGIFHFRCNTGALRTEKGGFVRFGSKGCPDIIIVIEGKFIGCECKIKKGVQSEYQKQFQRDLEKAGGRYLIIHSVEELIKSL